MRAFVQVRRYRAMLLIGLALGASLVGLDLIMTLVFGTDTTWHRPNIFWVYVERIGSQVAAAEDLQRIGQLPPNQLVVLLGASSVLRDFDGQLLHEHDPLHRRWLVLGGGGGTVSRLEVYAQPLLHSALKYKQVFVGLHPMMLWDGGHPDPLNDDVQNLVAGVTPHALRQAQAALLERSWLGRRWLRAYDTCRVAIYRARLAVLSACGQDCGATHEPAADPWAAYEMRTTDRHTPEAWAAQWERLQPRCRPEHYATAGTELAALKRLVRALRARGAAVTILRMPEHSRLRHEFDPRVLAYFDAAVAAAGGAEPLRVIDLSAAVEDELFFDHSHLNVRGRAVISRSLPTWTGDELRLANRP